MTFEEAQKYSLVNHAQGLGICAITGVDDDGYVICHQLGTDLTGRVSADQLKSMPSDWKPKKGSRLYGQENI